MLNNNEVMKMDETYRKFFMAMTQFHKLKLGDLFPDMTKMDCMTLMTIAHFYKEEKAQKKINTSKLAERMHAKQSAISRTLKKLEEKGLIVRTIDKEDRRNTYVEMTDKGRQAVAENKKKVNEVFEAVFSKMEKKDIEQLAAYLDRIYQLTKQEIEIRTKQEKDETRTEAVDTAE